MVEEQYVRDNLNALNALRAIEAGDNDAAIRYLQGAYTSTVEELADWCTNHPFISPERIGREFISQLTIVGTLVEDSKTPMNIKADLLASLIAIGIKSGYERRALEEADNG